MDETRRGTAGLAASGGRSRLTARVDGGSKWIRRVLLLTVALILSGCNAGSFPAEWSPDPTWSVVLISVFGPDGFGPVVGDDGVTCAYHPDFPIKEETEVRLRYGSGDAFMSATARDRPARHEGRPGDDCSIIYRFEQVPVTSGYLVEIPATPSGPPPGQPTYEFGFMMSMYTYPGDHTGGDAANGGGCTPKSDSPVKPGATFRTLPPADPAMRQVMVSKVTGDDLCVVRVMAALPAFAPAYAVAIGTFPLPGEGPRTPSAP